MSTLTESLRAGRVRLTFEKSDGTARTMMATLSEGLIGTIPPGGIPNRERLGLTTVWDMDLGQWRSFREDQVVSWEVVQ